MEPECDLHLLYNLLRLALIFLLCYVKKADAVVRIQDANRVDMCVPLRVDLFRAIKKGASSYGSY